MNPFNNEDEGLSSFKQFLAEYNGWFGAGMTHCPIATWLYSSLNSIVYCYKGYYKVYDIVSGKLQDMFYPKWAHDFIACYDIAIKDMDNTGGIWLTMSVEQTKEVLRSLEEKL